MKVPSRLAVGLAFALLLGGAIAADRMEPPSPIAAPPVVPLTPGGVLACPFLFNGNGSSWLHLVNAGSDTSKVTVTTVRENADPLFRTFTLDAGKTTTMTLDPAVRQASGAIVQFSGGEVAASRASMFGAGAGGRAGAAASCARAGDRTIVVPSGATLGADTTVLLLNPSTSDAVADVSLLTGGEELRPEGLKGIVVEARSLRRIRVGDFAFDERFVSTVIRVRTGVLAADGLISAPSGISLVPGGPPRRDLAGVATLSAGQGLIDVVGVGEADTVADAALLSPDGLTAFTALSEAIVPSTPQTVSLLPEGERIAATGAVLGVREGSGLSAALRWVVRLPNGRGDVSASEMLPPARRLMAVTGAPASAAQSRILLGNPGNAPAIVNLDLLTEQGRQSPAPFQGIRIEPGQALSLEIGTFPGSFAVVAVADRPVVMAISSTALSPVLASFTVTGHAAPAPQAVPVEPDPRVGVPAG
ncbi:MAG TPA: DUF5719 family protein [Actinomycetota bacterium]|nr:DUF5719 family protein [Actinomycetota bacterium]